MKKMKVKETIEKLSLGLLITMGLALPFIGCSNEDDLEETDVYTLSDKMATRGLIREDPEALVIVAGEDTQTRRYFNDDVEISYYLRWPEQPTSPFDDIIYRADVECDPNKYKVAVDFKLSERKAHFGELTTWWSVNIKQLYPEKKDTTFREQIISAYSTKWK